MPRFCLHRMTSFPHCSGFIKVYSVQVCVVKNRVSVLVKFDSTLKKKKKVNITCNYFWVGIEKCTSVKYQWL